MTIDERTRLRIRQWFVEQMDDEQMAGAIMESMPPVEWSELATKQDLALTTRELRTDMGELRTEMGELRVGMAALGVQMDEVRAELRGEIAQVRFDLGSFQRTMVLLLIGFALTIWVSQLVA